MPYLIGMHRQNMPDELMLDRYALRRAQSFAPMARPPPPPVRRRVVIVDLDSDSITVPDTEALPPLPDRLLRPLLKGLRKSVRDGRCWRQRSTHARTCPCVCSGGGAGAAHSAGRHAAGTGSQRALLAVLRAPHVWLPKWAFRSPPARPPTSPPACGIWTRLTSGGLCAEFIEAPSEFVVDKFQKDKFMKASPDNGPFLRKARRHRCRLASLPHGVALRVEQFLDTQMFQCFVDDRYGDAAQSQNLEAGRSRALCALPFWWTELDPGS
jgi:hypothetical protein